MTSPRNIDEAALSNWKLLEEFQKKLGEYLDRKIDSPSECDPRRKLDATGYFSLVLFAFFNPVVESMRGLCAASQLQRVQDEVTAGHAVSLGSFSEAQHVFEPGILQGVLRELSEEVGLQKKDPDLKSVIDEICLVDGTLIHTLRRMGWAYREDFVKRAAKLHVKYHLWKEIPVDAQLTPGTQCERKELKKMIKEGEWYVCDGYYSGSYEFIEYLLDHGCGFILRLAKNAVTTLIEENPLSPEDRAAGVVRDAWIILGTNRQLEGVRLIEVERSSGEIIRIICHDREMPAELIANIYRHRWHIEVFFKWLKSILKSKHLLAESEKGVAIHIYCALIAAILLSRASGKRPSKRNMELIHWYFCGWATLDELIQGLKLTKTS